MTRPLQGQVVLVTGAAKRIGRAIAITAAEQGARVAIHYHRSRTEAEDTAAACNAKRIFAADLCSVSEIERLVQDVVREYGHLDALVNNAGVYTARDPLALTEAEWDSTLNVNLKAVFFCAQQAARPMMARGRGRIVNLASLGGLRPWPEHAHYCSSKAGVVMLTQTLAKAWAPALAVNAVAPGWVAFEDDPERAGLVQATPMQRAGEAADVVSAVSYFLSAPTFITGQVLAVDGGLGLR